ncbi:hypothetical protein IJ596_07700 [bacterium]|nr:hypothetical protein [bacterium]
MYQDLKLQALAIGSLPHKDVSSAINLIKKDFSEIPFIPQLINISKNEDMIIQFLEGLPAFNPEISEKFVIDIENEEFLSGLEEFLSDYEEIISDINSSALNKYAISKNFSHAFEEFEKIIQLSKPKYAKAQIVGAFTLLTTLTDNRGNYAIYDDTYKEIIIKLLILKAMWQIKQIKSANPKTIPIIFMDEPTLSQLGTSAYLSVDINEVVNIIKEISDIIKSNGGISATHCCGKFDWDLLTKTNVDIIDFDAFSYSENISVYEQSIHTFLKNGGKIGWGIVPTLDESILENLNVDILTKKYTDSVKNLTKNGIDEKLVIDNSILTPSCGAGSLSIKGAERAMDLVFGLSNELKKRF